MLGRQSDDISSSWPMPRFFLNICQGEFAYPRLVAAHENIDAVRREARAIFADLAWDIVTRTTNPHWQMSVNEDTGKLESSFPWTRWSKVASVDHRPNATWMYAPWDEARILPPLLPITQ